MIVISESGTPLGPFPKANLHQCEMDKASVMLTYPNSKTVLCTPHKTRKDAEKQVRESLELLKALNLLGQEI